MRYSYVLNFMVDITVNVCFDIRTVSRRLI